MPLSIPFCGGGGGGKKKKKKGESIAKRKRPDIYSFDRGEEKMLGLGRSYLKELP